MMKAIICATLSIIATLAQAEFTCKVSVGRAASAGATREGTITWKNTGSAAVAAPYVRLNAGDGVFVRFTEADQWTKSLEFLATSSGVQASVLKGYEKGERTFLCKSSSDDDTMELSYTLASAESFPWADVENSLKPSFVSDTAWAFALRTLKARLGSTWDSYLGRFRADVDYLAALGRPVNRMDRLWQFEINCALGNDSAVPTLASAVDAARSARGLGLTLSRSYSSAMYARFNKGMFGSGWTDNLSVYAELTDATTLTFHMPDGGSYSFTKVTGNWAPEDARDKSTLVETSSAYVLTYQNGTKQTFAKSNMRTSSIADNSGNALTFTWNGTQLVKVAHTDGQSLTFAYSGGLVVSVTDDCGRQATYAYSGELLTSVTVSDGLVTRYAYRAADGTAAASALSRITYPDGTTKEFEYDAEGLVASVSINGGQEKTSIRRADGVITLIQPDGGKTVVKTGVSGEALETKDALGGISVNRYTEDGLLKSMTAPSGLSGSVSHDALGRVAQSMSAGGNTTAFAYEETFGNLKTVTDAKSHAVTYGYDAKGRGTSVSFPDGSMSRVEYNDRGDVVKSYNRRGESIAYTYDARGRVTKKTWSTGRTFTYAYDAHGNVTTATDSETGSVTMEYDAADRMTKIAYPNGRGFTFAYDSEGRLTRRAALDGAAERFLYDQQGRLSVVAQDNGGSGMMYLMNLYDQTTGRLYKQLNGNGTSTSYLYDKLGRVTSIEHCNAEGRIIEALQYCYDVDGRCIRASSLLGEERYGYDADGQLTAVDYPNNTYQTYAYDAVGNMISNNAAKFTVNAMNQYTKIVTAADEMSLAYDTDGNLTSTTDSNGTTTYTYDTLNRLTAVKNASAGIDWSCKYDVFGNRVSVTDKGVTTERVYLQGSLPSVAAEYVNGRLKERHILVGAVRLADVDADGQTKYLHADLIGSVRLVTGDDGSAKARASYLAFGGLRTGSIENSAGYVGTLGVETDSTGLLFMRNRYYSPVLGRFIQMDPIGHNGGDENLYDYCFNDALSGIDLTGRSSFDLGQFSIDFADAIGWDVGAHDFVGASSTAFGAKTSQTVLSKMAVSKITGIDYGKVGSKLNEVNASVGIKADRAVGAIKGINLAANAWTWGKFLVTDYWSDLKTGDVLKFSRDFFKTFYGGWFELGKLGGELVAAGVIWIGDLMEPTKTISGTMNDFYDMSGEIAKALGVDGLEDITWSEGGMIFKDASLVGGSGVRLSIPAMSRPKKTQNFVRTLSATVEGPCTVSFGMRMSSYMLLDEVAGLIFVVDGQSVGGTEIIYWDDDLTSFNVTIRSSGSHRIEWRYAVTVYSGGPSTAGPFYADIGNVRITKPVQAMVRLAGSPAVAASALPNDVDPGPRIFSYDRYVLARGYDYSFGLSAESGAGLSVSGLPEGFSFSDGRITGAANDTSEGEITIVSSKGSAKGEKKVPFVVVDEPSGFDIQYNGGSPDIAFYEDEEYPDGFYLYNADGSGGEGMIIREGDLLGFWMCFANMNWGTLARPFLVRLQCSNGVSYDYSVDRLSAGQYLGGWFDLPDVFQGLAPGSYSLTCVLDPDDTYEETDELNNSRSVDFTIEESRVEFREPVVFAAEGGEVRVAVRGGRSDGPCDVKLYLAPASADAKDLDLTKLTVDGVAVKNAKFPLTLSWAAGDVSERVVEIPIKADTAVEGYEQFDLQLADANGIGLGDACLCSVSVKDETVGANLAQAVNNPSIKVATSGDGKWIAANGNEGYIAGDYGMYHLQSPALASGKTSTLNLSGVSGSGQIVVAYRFVGDYTGGKSASLRLLADKRPLKTDTVLYHSSIGSEWKTFTITDDNKGNHTYSYVFTQGDDPNVHVEVAMAKWVPAGGSEPVMVYVSSNGSGYGTVSGMGFYAIGATAKITAKPAPGRQFAGWYKYSNASQQYELYDQDHMTLSIKVTESLNLRAVFLNDPYVRAVALPADGGKVSGSGYVASGKKVTLKATANKNFTFEGWYASKTDARNAIDESHLVATTASLVIDRGTKPTANSKTSTTVTDISGDVTYFAKFKSYPEAFVSIEATDGNVNAGKITGAGKYAPGKKVTLKVTANKGYVFNGWYEGEGLVSQAASYAFTMPTEDVAYVAKFVTVEEDKASIAAGVNGMEFSLTSGQETASPLATNVMCGVYLEWPVAASALSEPTVAVSGLPSGLKFTTKPVTSKVGSGKTAVTVTNVPPNTIYGAPTAASKVDKNGNVTPSKVKVTVTTAGKSKAEYVIDLTVDSLPAWAQGEFCGLASMPDGRLGGASMSVTAAGKVTGKVIVNGTNVSFAAANYDISSKTVGETNLVAVVTGKLGKDAVTGGITVVASGASGTFVGAEMTLHRNVWKDKGADPVPAEVQGLYTVKLGAGERGTGYLSLTVDKKGAVKVAGKAPDGTALSASATLMPNVDGAYFADVFAAPSSYKGGYVAGRLGWDADGRVSSDGLNWTSFNPQSTGDYEKGGFDRALDCGGAKYDKTASLKDGYDTLRLSALGVGEELFITVDQTGKKFVVVDKGDAKLTFTFTQTTGIWQGTYLMWPDPSSTKSVKVSFEGILVSGEEDLKGFGTYDATSFYPTYDRTGKKTGEKSYKYKESVPVDFIDGHKFL